MDSESSDDIFDGSVQIEDFWYEEDSESFTYPCPCEDYFSITKYQILNGIDVARCERCPQTVKVNYQINEPSDILLIIAACQGKAKAD